MVRCRLLLRTVILIVIVLTVAVRWCWVIVVLIARISSLLSDGEPRLCSLLALVTRLSVITISWIQDTRVKAWD